MNFFLDGRVATRHFPGIGRYVSNLAVALPPLLESGERLLVLRDPRVSGSEEIGGVGGATFACVDVLASPFSLAQQWRVPRALAGASGLYHAPYPVMAYRSGIPSIVTVHDVIPLGAAGGMPLHARLLFRTLLGLALRASRCVITVSASTRRDLLARSRIEPARVFTIPLAAAPQFRPASQAECARVRSRYRLPARYVLYVGINKPHKNLTRLIEAWRLALPTAATRRECPLVIAGPWDPRYPDAREISERLNVSPSVRYLGPVGDADLAPLYSGAGLFVLPSLCEGFGLPILEAMECGAPVACADRDGPPEVAGGAAALFDPTNVPAMARVIADVLGSPALAARLRERGFARSRTFSWERTAAATLALYRELSS